MTSEQEEQVRRALGSLPPEGPVPPKVAERLDATLADLLSERGPAASTTGPDPSGDDALAARRRRRWRAGLVAAAGVAVLGVGLGTLVDQTGGGDAGQSTLADEAASDAGGRAAAPEAATEDSARRYVVSSGTLDDDVARIAALGPVQSAREGVASDSTGPEGGPQAGPDGTAGSLAGVAPCALPSTEQGDQVVPVRLDGDPATLVLRAPVGGTREAQIYSCDDGGEILATSAVPAR